LQIFLIRFNISKDLFLVKIRVRWQNDWRSYITPYVCFQNKFWVECFDLLCKKILSTADRYALNRNWSWKLIYYFNVKSKTQKSPLILLILFFMNIIIPKLKLKSSLHLTESAQKYWKLTSLQTLSFFIKKENCFILDLLTDWFSVDRDWDCLSADRVTDVAAKSGAVQRPEVKFHYFYFIIIIFYSFNSCKVLNVINV
jgi:hypothetical protein